MKTVAIVGTFDTKARELQYIKALIEEKGMQALCINTGVFEPQFQTDISNREVAAEAGANIEELANAGDRATATEMLSRGLEKLVPRLYAEGRFDGIISTGGSGGTALSTPAMRALPIGVPKVMVSTMASGNVAQYVGTSDIIMMPSVVDVEGLNVISMRVFSNAVNAVTGMVRDYKDIPDGDKPLIAATMFGVTTPCIKEAKAYLEERGYEVLVFHATGTGGRSMEALIEAGFVKGVLDLTTTEWCDELYSGVLNAGPNRLEAAGKMGIPQVVSVGALDMVNFGPWDTVPKEFKDRNLYKHNPTVTLMRTTAEENVGLGKIISQKLNMANGATVLMLPLKGVSGIDAEGQPFYGPEEDKALFDTLRNDVDKSKVEIVEVDQHINDPAFAKAAAQKLVDLMSAVG
ncbi:Tm-1-like ATP-binding domain-containing protein [Agathobaculum ammoniilyticum]|uniref:Tm-1-like ATP-binding domain-containing protein n=1 Tax=Agathobaculum ammoniilyticum TaxID=2981778 RepID=A0ABT2U6G8_9FIRM|nr:Tm-1-like ATP-binding domain-containing protein [Agathobaculum ammoniilyticum]MBS6884117.1 Tm-1-like ATP-binding domain-containing protein [Clostridiaceae bacterium]MCU6790219.1 Tm-1-like ATP-binding domain-containing protein [Agathobaculum ammoniilyticum]